jgi:hypothetical protein
VHDWCLISSKTVQISRAKFHKIQKTNNAHDVTMTSNTYRFCKYGAIYGTYSPQFFLWHWRRIACTEFFSTRKIFYQIIKINKTQILLKSIFWVSRGVKFLEKRRENVQIFQALRWRDEVVFILFLSYICI